ncbi:DUF411 domain-containing protein [Burkholderia contaminans]|uniref:DUF411 domain-containing protein n=1 Tax=Burkholderia contaminans TaxID=488447 RepID=UPI00158351F5|nr:DUF411 domain-containing protein [Burkholderia contaminans]
MKEPFQVKSISHTRRAVAAALALLPVMAFSQKAVAKSVQVWKTPTCGCCEDWISHLKSNGFEVAVQNVDDTVEARRKAGMPDRYASCHTGIVQGYAIEGHVPAREIMRLLRERPNAIGLAVPSMPIGAPGMDGPAYGGRHMPYNVLLVNRDGRSSVFQSYS